MVRNMTHMGTNPMKTVIKMYTDCWKSNCRDVSGSENGTPKVGEALVVTSDGLKSKSPLKES
jgi:hypothetical protein